MSDIGAGSNMAIFLDLENIVLGAKEAKFTRFDIKVVLERLLLRGHTVVKKAYCDFERYKDFKRDLHENAFELIEIPHVRQSGKNSADIRMVVDALDLCYTKPHLNTFVILSGDSDFSPLVSKLRENAKTVLGMGVKKSSSDLFISNCDEFIYYDDLVREKPKPATAAKQKATAAAAQKPSPTNGAGDAPTSAQALDQVVTALEALQDERGDDDRIWGSMIKQVIKRRNPGFNERAHGFKSFNSLLLEAQKQGLLKLENVGQAGQFVVEAID